MNGQILRMNKQHEQNLFMFNNEWLTYSFFWKNLKNCVMNKGAVVDLFIKKNNE